VVTSILLTLDGRVDRRMLRGWVPGLENAGGPTGAGE